MEHSQYVTWFEKTAIERPTFKALQEDIHCDICIIGGAFTGVSAALYAAQQGKKVVLIEPSKIGFGCTGRAGGIIESGLHAELDDLASFQGHVNAHKFWQSTIDARTSILNNIQQYSMNCGFSEGLVKVNRSPKNAEEWQRKAEYFSANFKDEFITYLNKDDVQDVIHMPSAKQGLYYGKGGSFNPLSYLFAMAQSAVKNGAEIYENTKVLQVQQNKDNHSTVIQTENAKVTCDNLIICGNAFMDEEQSPEKTRTVSSPYFQLVTKPLSEQVFKHLTAKGEVVTAYDGMEHYIQFTNDRRLIYGGPSYKTVKNVPKFAQKQILFLEKLLPSLKGQLQADYLWHGPVGMPMNYVPIFAKIAPHYYVAHGFNGHGVALSCFGGQVLVDALLGQDELFDIYARIKPIKLPKWLHHSIAKIMLLFYRFTRKPFVSS